ncbi:NADPH2:quinone reductase [Paraburkholderia strydomiana]|nr:NADPH2:quinone reductase [Paraburkholderia strydomiana]
MKMVSMTRVGEPEVLEVVDCSEPTPGSGQVLVEVAAAGVNFMDIGVRLGRLWREIPLPRGLGVEGAGRVLAVGEGVSALRRGQRVAWVYGRGSYAERLVLPAEALVPLPDAIDERTAAAVMMQGLTASHFATKFYPVQPGDVALVHAAAGGVGLLLTQIIKMRGGTVIGRVSSEQKVAVAKNAGADHVIVDTEAEFTSEVIRLSGGEGVNVVYDGSGQTTFQASLDSLRRCGTLCWYGPVLGAPEPIEIARLPKSIKVGFANFADSISTPELFKARSAELFAWIAQGKLKIHIGGMYPLSEAARAHADMEARLTTGKLLLIP